VKKLYIKILCPVEFERGERGEKHLGGGV